LEYAGTWMENFPAESVCVVAALPRTATVTPASGVRAASSTVPVMVLSGTRMKALKKRASSIRIFVFMVNQVLVYWLDAYHRIIP
jgi:hypothetical protein